MFTSSDLHDVHARLPELVGEHLPAEEVEHHPGLGHHHLAVCHIVQGLKITFFSSNSDILILKLDHGESAQSTSS